MNVDNENIERVTDLGLALSYSNHSIQRQMNIDSGAGANASSKIDMTFVASDPLSELVWSPHKGLSLKCADSSFADKKASLLWGAGPRNVDFPAPQSFMGGSSTTDKPIDEVITPQAAACHAKDDSAGTNTLTASPSSAGGGMPECGPSHEHETGPIGNMEERKSMVGLSVLHVIRKEDLRKSEDDDIFAPTNIQIAVVSESRENNSSLPGLVNGGTSDIISTKTVESKLDVVANEPFSGDPRGAGGDFGSGNQILGKNINLASDVHCVGKCKASETPVQNLSSLGKRPLEMLEFTAENDLQTLIGDNACVVANKIVESEFANEGKAISQPDKEVLPRNKTVPIEISPTNSRIHMPRRKGKEKALSDGDIDRRLSKEGDDSHESVESCNSRLFSTGKKRWSFEEPMIFGSKRVKSQIQETPGSTSYAKKGSSFMNWISNMTKGFSKPMQDEAPSLALAIAHPDHGHQNLLTCNKNQDSGFKNIGFRSIFQSLYCPKAEGELPSFNANYQTGEGSKEHELANKMCNINATPISIRRDSDKICKQNLLPNDKFDESTSGNEVGSATQPKTFPGKFVTSQENSKINSGENKNSCNMDFGKGKYGISSNSPLGKHRTTSAENIDSDLPSEGKKTNDYRKGPLGSLWITRFYSKASGSLSNLDFHNQSIGVGVDCSTDCTRLLPCPENYVGFSNNHKSVAVREHSAEGPMLASDKESEKCPADTKAVVGFNWIKSHNDHKSVNKLNPISPPPKFKSSEAMASIFARRLDALKHIIPSEVTDTATHANITCLFCGIKGHHLQECSKITESEMEDLLRNNDSYNGAEDSSCLCIRCFQLNHWAVACPSTSSRGQNQTRSGASLVGPREMQHKAGGKENSKPLSGWKRKFQATCDESDLRISDHNFNGKLNKMIAPEEIGSNANSLNKCIASSSVETYSKENQIMPVNRQLSDVPKGIFITIKSLRLSRSDILK
uniref:CCHC-type domain-containing protein n=1 Tax=Fagus sylvatica TaxID=28930 RepID=A0A2N9ENU4_FAGSY